MIRLIEEICEVKDYALKLRFNTGEVLKIDLEDQLNEWAKPEGSKYRDLLNPQYFAKVEMDNEMQSIKWSNGIDLCPDVLYSLAKKPHFSQAI